jgi:hypothetical protein
MRFALADPNLHYFVSGNPRGILFPLSFFDRDLDGDHSFYPFGVAPESNGHERVAIAGEILGRSGLVRKEFLFRARVPVASRPLVQPDHSLVQHL